MNQVAKMNICCDKKAEIFCKSPSSGYEPQINLDMTTGTKVFPQVKGVTNVKNLYKKSTFITWRYPNRLS